MTYTLLCNDYCIHVCKSCIQMERVGSLNCCHCCSQISMYENLHRQRRMLHWGSWQNHERHNLLDIIYFNMFNWLGKSLPQRWHPMISGTVLLLYVTEGTHLNSLLFIKVKTLPVTFNHHSIQWSPVSTMNQINILYDF